MRFTEHELSAAVTGVAKAVMASQDKDVRKGRRDVTWRRNDERIQKRVEKLRHQLEQYEAFCREIGAAPADVGVAWLLHQKAVTAPIIGPRTMEQFEGALSALQLTLDADQLARLDEIFPGYKAAPMEYAW